MYTHECVVSVVEVTHIHAFTLGNSLHSCQTRCSCISVSVERLFCSILPVKHSFPFFPTLHKTPSLFCSPSIAYLPPLPTPTPKPPGHAVWLDPKQSRSSHSSNSNLILSSSSSSAAAAAAGKTRCLVLWRRLPEVAADIATWAAGAGVADSVMLVDELSSGPEVRGTGWYGVCWHVVCGGGKCGRASHTRAMWVHYRQCYANITQLCWLMSCHRVSLKTQQHTASQHNHTKQFTTHPPELEGLHREVLVRALQLLEAQGKVK